MMNVHRILRKNEKGATVIFVALILTMLLGFAALGVDVNYVYGVRNELHNAADAGALAGASMLFDSNDELTSDAAILEATRVVNANKTGKQAVVVKTVEIGQWSFFPDRKFEPTADPELINAVKVVTEREKTPSFFAKILGFADFLVSADAVAMIGNAGDLYVDNLDQPMAICEDAILHDKTYDEDVCNMARMSNDGGSPGSGETSMWTDFSQDQDNPDIPEQDSCDTASKPKMEAITDGCSGNPYPLKLGLGIGTTNGAQTPTLENIIDCWHKGKDLDDKSIDTNLDGIPDQPWPIRLPVVDCDSSNTCATLVGAVVVNVIWMHKSPDPWQNIKSDEMIPTQMGGWGPCATGGTKEGRQACWRSFVDFFNLRNLDMNKDYKLTETDYETMYEQKQNIYFQPSCDKYTPTGHTGGKDFGIRAKYPKLVE